MLSPGQAVCSGWWSPLQVGADRSVRDRVRFLQQLLLPVFLWLGIQLRYKDCSAAGRSLFQNNRWEPRAAGAPLLGSGMEGVGCTGGWDDGNWGAWGTEVHWLSGLGSGQGGPRGETRKPTVQGGTWAPWALFQAGSSGSSTGGSAPPGTA